MHLLSVAAWWCSGASYFVEERHKDWCAVIVPSTWQVPAVFPMYSSTVPLMVSVSPSQTNVCICIA